MCTDYQLFVVESQLAPSPALSERQPGSIDSPPSCPSEENPFLEDEDKDEEGLRQQQGTHSAKIAYEYALPPLLPNIKPVFELASGESHVGRALAMEPKDARQGMTKRKRKQDQPNKQATGTPDLSGEQQQEPPSPRTQKRKQSECVTLEPWRTLTMTVHDLVC